MRYQIDRQGYYKMLSQFDRQFLKRQIKILSTDYSKWHRQQLARLLALLKIPQPILKDFLDLTFDTTNHKTLSSLSSLTDKIQPTLTQLTYFPFQKLKSALTLMSMADDESNQSVLNKNLMQKNQQIYIKQQNVLLLKNCIQKLDDCYVIEMNTEQIYMLLKNSELQGEAVLLKKYAIDGFCLVCLLCDWDIVRDIRNYFKDEEIRIFTQMSCLFMTHYFNQQIRQKLRKLDTLQTKKVSSTTTNENPKQYIIQASQLSKKYSQDDIDFQDENQMGESVMGNSEYATSEMGESVMEGDIRGSVIRDSVYAHSQFADSVRGSVDCRMSFRVADNNGRASMMYNSEILNQLKQVCLNLPFDLLNLEPLQQIKFRSLKTPFGKQIDKDCWIFSVKGAKLGRDKQNDLRYPDELSISGKHAQILFKTDGFHLQDLGSKTGTYIKIQKILPIEDELYVQFSTQAQILFKVIKKTATQGTIKAEIKKPENMNDYKITIKQKNKIKIGRSERCHIRINNQLLAQKHSQVFYKDGQFYFKNCHSTCLSWIRLSAKSVVSPHFQLNVGDIFRLSSKKSFVVQEIYNYFAK